MMEKRICPICGNEFDVTVPNKIYCCRKCKNKAKLDKAKKNRQPKVKKCLLCGKEFIVESGGQLYCCKEHALEANKINQKARYLDNIEAKKAYDKERYQRNKDKVKKRVNQYRLDNLDKHKEYLQQHKPQRNARLRARYKNDPVYRMEQRTKGMLSHQLKKKSERTHKILGYSGKELMKHLETMFYDDMSWENTDTWEVHHIIPINEWNLLNEDGTDNLEEVRKANALSNLMPLKKEDHYRVTAIYNSSRTVLTKEEIYDIIIRK